MNDYRITYTSETGESSNAYVTERTEAAARKSFNASHKGMGFTIQEVELHRENTCATKAQEREALEAIRKMVEELGPQSYLATAFDGVFEDAETNIENDFAFSMKARLELAEAKVEELTDEREALLSQLDSAKIDLKREQERAAKEMETVKAELDEAKKHILRGRLHKDLWLFLTDEAERDRGRMAQSAEIMADKAETPEDIAFVQAVENYRKSKERAILCEEMAAEVEKIGLEE